MLEDHHSVESADVMRYEAETATGQKPSVDDEALKIFDLECLLSAYDKKIAKSGLIVHGKNKRTMQIMILALSWMRSFVCRRLFRVASCARIIPRNPRRQL